MNQDLNELKDFVAALKSDKQAQKDKEKREGWTKFVSLSMVCLAVLTAIATLRAGGYSSATLKQLNDATFNQANASDQWAYFQAKSIKQNLYEMERDRAATAGADAKIVEKASAKIDRYETEKGEIKKKAEEFEHKRDAARKAATYAADRSREMGLAITAFQVAIALGGICLVVKKRWLWAASLTVGTAALAQMIKVFNMPL